MKSQVVLFRRPSNKDKEKKSESMIAEPISMHKMTEEEEYAECIVSIGLMKLRLPGRMWSGKVVLNSPVFAALFTRQDSFVHCCNLRLERPNRDRTYARDNSRREQRGLILILPVL